MNHLEPETDALASGLTRSNVEALLANAEPRRLEVLSASLNLTLAIVLMAAGEAIWTGDLFRLSIAVFIGGMVWPIGNRLWRDLAMEAIAPAIGARWGQTAFASGWSAMALEDRVTALFSTEGAHSTAWTSEGTYRDIAYRLSETTIWHRRRSNGPREVSHVIQAEIKVPQPFSGRIELTPAAGVMSRVDDVFRRLTDSVDQRRHVDPAFDAVFDTIATQQTPIEQLLTPDFRRAMLALAARHPRLYLTARFEHGWFSLRLPIPHLIFTKAGLLTPMNALAEDTDTLWWELTIPHRLIDGLMGDHDGPLR